ncbi:MAG: helix-turn-helix domain-containing protein [Bacteroidota bacterium]
MLTLPLLGAIQGFLVGIFLFFKRSNYQANRFLALSIIISSIQFLLLIFWEDLSHNNFQLNLRFCAWFLAFPIPVLYFFYVKLISSESPKFHTKDLLHFLPTLMGILAVSPIWTMSQEEKIRFMAEQSQTFVIQSKLLEMAHGLVIIVYAILCLFILKDFKNRIRNEFSNLDKKQLSWLWILTAMVGLVGLAGVIGSSIGLVQACQNQEINSLDRSSHFVTLAIVTIVFYWSSFQAITQPEIFTYTYPHPKKEKYSHSKGVDGWQTLLISQLTTSMESDRLFLRSDLNLTELAEILGVSRQELSQVINEHFEKNFFDFINAYRLEEAKMLLLDPQYSKLTIRGISQEAGFKSKSTFYSLFKQHTGMTPTNYQKEKKGEEG